MCHVVVHTQKVTPRRRLVASAEYARQKELEALNTTLFNYEIQSMFVSTLATTWLLSEQTPTIHTCYAWPRRPLVA